MSNIIPLENITIATPCRADWNRMQGDNQTRFCSTCQKNVYNISKLSKAEAEALIQAKEGNLCVRFYQRPDGTIITDDCPVGLKLVRRPYKWLMAAGAAMLALVSSLVGVQAQGNIPVAGGISVRPAPTATPTPKPGQTMGKPVNKKTAQKREVRK